MANIYDVNAALKTPDIVGNFNKGVQIGQQNQVYGQKQAAYQDALSRQQQVQNLAPQIIAGDPQATEQAQAIDPTTAKQYADPAQQHLKRLQGAISYIDSQKDPQAKEAAYQQVRPYLAQFGQQPPATFAEAEPKMEQARAQIASINGQQEHKYMNVPSQGSVFDQTTGKVAYTNPGAPPKPQLVQAADGSYVWATPGAGATPLTYGGGQQSPQGQQAQPQPQQEPPHAGGSQDPMNAIIAQANQMAAQGVPDAQVQQFIMQTAQKNGIQMGSPGQDQGQPQPQPQPVGAPPPMQPGDLPTMTVSPDPADMAAQAQAQPSAGFGQSEPSAGNGAVPGAPVMGPQKVGNDQFRTASPDEIKQLGLPEGTVAQIGSNGKINVVDKGINVQGASSAPAFGDNTKSGADYIQTIPSDERDVVKGVLNATKQLPTGSALKSPYWQSIMASVIHADPSWNEAAYKQYADTRKYMTIGKGGSLINSINTGAQHLQKLVSDINAMDNSKSQDWNSLANNIAGRMGNQSVTDFEGDITPVASELASIYKNGGTPTDQETQHWREALSPNMSKQQQLSVVRGWIDLLAGKLNSTHNQYRQSMSKLSEPLDVINPKAAAALENITKLSNQVTPNNQHATPTIDQTPIYAPGQQPSQAQQQSAQGGWSIQRVQ